MHDDLRIDRSGTHLAIYSHKGKPIAEFRRVADLAVHEGGLRLVPRENVIQLAPRTHGLPRWRLAVQRHPELIDAAFIALTIGTTLLLWRTGS